MPSDRDPFDEADEIINESDENVEDLVADTEVEDPDDTESYEEYDDEASAGYDNDGGDPEELNFEPSDDDEPSYDEDGYFED